MLQAKLRSKAAWVIVIVGILAFILVLLFMAPYDALDIYDNIFHGRIVGIYGSNPFQQLISNFPNDPFFSYTRWKNVPSAYGPMWEMLAGLTARLAGNGIIANVLAFKLLPGVFQLASVAVIALFLRRTAPDQTLSGVLLAGWNPVVLYETWGNGHNDMAMVFWIILAVFLISRKRYTLATLSLVAGALIKYVPVLLIPSALLVGYYGLNKLGTRLWFLMKTLLGSVLMTVAAYFVFWNGVASLSINRRMQMFSTSIPSVIVNVLYQRFDFIESSAHRQPQCLGAPGHLHGLRIDSFQKSGTRTNFFPNSIQHPCVLFDGHLPLVPAMVWNLADRLGCSASQPLAKPGFTIWILGFEQTVYIWPSDGPAHGASSKKNRAVVGTYIDRCCFRCALDLCSGECSYIIENESNQLCRMK